MGLLGLEKRRLSEWEGLTHSSKVWWTKHEIWRRRNESRWHSLHLLNSLLSELKTRWHNFLLLLILIRLLLLELLPELHLLLHLLLYLHVATIHLHWRIELLPQCLRGRRHPDELILRHHLLLWVHLLIVACHRIHILRGEPLGLPTTRPLWGCLCLISSDARLLLL
jgi:hypothetical protein